jgi:hypothetical protein
MREELSAPLKKSEARLKQDADKRVAALVRKSTRSSKLPAEVTDRTLSDDERLRAWIYIQRQRKEWDAKEKEMVA